MPSQKDMETSAPITPEPSAKPATPATPTAPAAPAATATTSPSTPSATVNPETGIQFKDECIVLVLGPKGTVHPMVQPANPAGVRIFESADAAISEVMTSRVASTRPFAVVALKGLF